MNPARRPRLNAPAILLVGLALAVIAMVRGCLPLSTQVLGRVLPSQGSRASVPLRAGDVLKTADGSPLALSLTPGIMAWISGRSELKVEELRIVKIGENVEERFAQVRLERGTAIFSVGSPADRKADLRVLTPGIETEAEPGSAFAVSVSGNGATGRLLCTAGALRWQDSARVNGGWVISGQFQDFGAGAPSGPREISSDGAAQLATLALFDSVRALNQAGDQLPTGLIPRTVKSGKGESLMK